MATSRCCTLETSSGRTRNTSLTLYERPLAFGLWADGSGVLLTLIWVLASNAKSRHCLVVAVSSVEVRQVRRYKHHFLCAAIQRNPASLRGTTESWSETIRKDSDCFLIPPSTST